MAVIDLSKGTCDLCGRNVTVYYDSKLSTWIIIDLTKEVLSMKP